MSRRVPKWPHVWRLKEDSWKTSKRLMKLLPYIARRASRWTGADVMMINSFIVSPASGQMIGESTWPDSYRSLVMTPLVVSRGFMTVEFDFGELDWACAGFWVVVVVVVVFSTENDQHESFRLVADWLIVQAYLWQRRPSPLDSG